MKLFAHEIAHCFGLQHNDTDFTLKHYEARWLDKHYHFNENVNNFTFPQMNLNQITMTATRDQTIQFELEVTSDVGLHQAIISESSQIQTIAWDFLNGENKDTILFEADRDEWTSRMYLFVMDLRGNYTAKTLSLTLPPEIGPAKNPDLDVAIEEERETEDVKQERAINIQASGIFFTHWAELKRQ